jgi:POT family proton-dependent oligopeptide transporter
MCGEFVRRIDHSRVMTITADELDIAPSRAGRFLGHPVGLAYLVITEAFERFSYYGMQGLLVLYMTERLLLPGAIEHVAGFGSFRAAIEGVFGQLSTTALATQVFGLYGGSVYLTPILGGFIGDRYGRRLTVMVGLVTMALGHFLMAFESLFLPALAVLIVGSGLLKGNIAAQVGALYGSNDSRRDRAFSIYYIGINVGATFAPLACGTLGEVYGWHYGFTAAGIGMLVGLAIYLQGRRFLPADPPRVLRGERPKLTGADWKIVVALLFMVLVSALFWTGQAQIWNTYTLWVRDRVDRHAFGQTIPVTWFQSVDAISAFVVAGPVIGLWARQSRKGTEPSDLAKIAAGCLLFGVSILWLSAGDFLAGRNGMVPWPWAFTYHFLSAVGYFYFAPTVIALFSRTAPASINAMMIAVYFLSTFGGSIASGWLGRFYETLSGMNFWAVHAAIAASGGILVLLLWRPLTRILGIR